MILELKRDGRKKGRLILQGFREPLWWDKGPIDSPVASHATIRTLVFMGGRECEVISSVDIRTAFLQSKPYDPTDPPRYVYYEPYPGGKRVYKRLTGPIYGQRVASMAFYKTLSEWLTTPVEEGGMGYTKGKNEPCMFKKGGHTVVVWVDDLLCRGSVGESEAFYKALAEKFDIKDPTYLTPECDLAFVGFSIGCERRTEGMYYYMSQESSVETFLEDAGLGQYTGVESPMPNKDVLTSDGTEVSESDASYFRSCMGTLNYYAHTLRYDMAYAVNRLL